MLVRMAVVPVRLRKVVVAVVHQGLTELQEQEEMVIVAAARVAAAVQMAAVHQSEVREAHRVEREVMEMQVQVAELLTAEVQRQTPAQVVAAVIVRPNQEDQEQLTMYSIVLTAQVVAAGVEISQ